MNIFERSLKLSTELFPRQVLTTNSSRPVNYHFSFGYRKNRLVGIGINDELNESPKVKRLAQRFGISHFQKFPFPHSEIDLLSKLWGNYYVDESLRIINVRINRHGYLRYSKPCSNCTEVLRALNVTEVWYTTGDVQQRFLKWS